MGERKIGKTTPLATPRVSQKGLILFGGSRYTSREGSGGSMKKWYTEITK